VFALKGIAGTLLSPLAIGGVAAILAVLLFLIPRTRPLGGVTLALLAIGGFALGTTPVANALIEPLERGYVAVPDPVAVADSIGEPIRWIVVLGSGHASDPRAAAPGRLSGEALHRLAEGIRLWRALPGGRLHLSGWSGRDTVSHAEASREAALALGVPADAIALAPEPRDTQEEARAVAGRLPAGEIVFLVSGAAHLRRATRFFESEGLRPIPAPALFYAVASPTLGLGDLLPSAAGYAKVDRAAHEYLGLLWARIVLRE
jgi:uncharacterized SAM-binding protein YcdF (DUF218 family)